MSSFEFIGLAIWVGIVALQLADLSLTASRVPQLSAFGGLLDEVQDAAHARPTTEQLDDFRDRLSALDDREAARFVPPARGANTHLWKGVPWQLVAVAISFLPMIASTSLPGASLGTSLVGLLLPVISYVLALSVARASLGAAGARSSLHAHQRADIIALLDEAARTSRRRVAGLGDRVARALQILREQQAQ